MDTLIVSVIGCICIFGLGFCLGMIVFGKKNKNE